GRAAIAAREVGEQIGGREKPLSQRAVLGRIQRRAPEFPGQPRGHPQGRGAVVAGLIERVEHRTPFLVRCSITLRGLTESSLPCRKASLMRQPARMASAICLATSSGGRL